MQRVLRFKRHLCVEPFDEERVFLVGERERFMLQGRAHALVAPLVDGRRSIGEIMQALQGRVSAPEVYYSLMLLEERGYLTEAAVPIQPEVAAYWESLGYDAARVAESLAATPVAVRGLGGEEPGPLAEALAAAGVQVRDEAEVQVVLTGSYLHAELERWGSEACQRGLRWMPLKPLGAECWMGPMFRADSGPCLTCLTFRLRENRPVERYLQRRMGRSPVAPRAGLAAGASAGLSLAAVVLARWIVDGGRGALDEKVLVLEPGVPRLSEHRVIQRPQCPNCGEPGLVSGRALQPVVLESRPKRFTDDGGHRCMTPEETLARYQHHVSPITGILADVQSVAGGDPFRQVYSAVFRVTPWSATPASDDFHRTGSGKGRTSAQARAGALCEALERYSATFQGDECRIRARYSQLGEDAIHPALLQGFSEAQYRARDAVKDRRDMRAAVPLPYEDEEIDWTPVWSLLHQRRRHVPTSYCYLYAETPVAEQFCYFNSNGNAAGNCLEEALLQGFLELVERDAVAVWWYNRLRRPRVDLESFGEPYFPALVEHYRSLGMRLWVLDITHDLGIPTFSAIAWANDSGRIWAGCGSHFDARLAVQRALTEVNQCFNPQARSRSPWEAAALADPAYLLPDEAVPMRSRRDFPEVRREDLRDDVLACVELAARAGLETLVLDQTRPDIGLSAVKVIVPGLRHFWPRFGPGRLYDVPMRMGWLREPLPESRMNPVPFFF